MSEFYIYVYLREDGSPYYVGKGKGNRAWSKNRRIPPPTDPSLIVIVKEFLTETEAFDEERLLIAFYGRKDKGTGILRNLTDGGEGSSGWIPSAEYREKMSAALSGENNPMFGRTGVNNPKFGQKASKKTRDKMSAAKIGKKPHNYGQKDSAKTRAKKSAAQSGANNPMFGRTGENSPRFGKPNCPSEETKAKRLATRKRNREAKDLLQHQ